MRLPDPPRLYRNFVVLPLALSEFSHLPGHFSELPDLFDCQTGRNRRTIRRIKTNWAPDAGQGADSRHDNYENGSGQKRQVSRSVGSRQNHILDQGRAMTQWVYTFGDGEARETGLAYVSCSPDPPPCRGGGAQQQDRGPDLIIDKAGSRLTFTDGERPSRIYFPDG
jgi:hypothetical protein